jgi:hypothetical protein
MKAETTLHRELREELNYQAASIEGFDYICSHEVSP